MLTRNGSVIEVSRCVGLIKYHTRIIGFNNNMAYVYDIRRVNRTMAASVDCGAVGRAPLK